MAQSPDATQDHAFDTDFDVVDVDAHFAEAIDEYAAYLDEPLRSEILDHPDGAGYAKKRLIPTSTGDREMGGRIMRKVTPYRDTKITPDMVPGIMDHLGLDEIVLLSQDMLSFARIQADDRRASQIANAYMDYMLDQVVDPSEGIYTSIPVPWQTPDAAVELIDRVGDERGVVGSCLVSAGPEPPLGDRRYDGIFEATEDKGLAAIVHTGGSGLDGFHVKGYQTFLETHTLGFLQNNQSQLVSLVVQGVPEKFPDLDIVFMESGLFWVPALMHRLDAEYLKRTSEAPLLTRRPSDYMQEFYYGTQPLEVPENETYLEQTIEMIGGASQVMYASDYPHWDYDRPISITERPFLSDAEKQAILAGNAREVFGL